MEQDIYGYSLCAALTLMIFFGAYFIFSGEPDKPVFRNYIRSRRIMGAALLVLSTNYMVHLLLQPRFTAPDAAILMNLSSYYISAWLFSSALTSLLDRHYLTRRKFTLHIISWLCFTATAGAVMILFPSGKSNTVGIIALTLWFLIYAFNLASRLIRKYRKAVRLFDETQSDDIGAYIRWLSVFTWWAVIYGVGCGLFTFIPYFAEIEKRLTEWTGKDGYTRPGLTIGELAGTLGTNRTYLADYIKSVYHVTFREWIAALRIEYAKRLLSEHPGMTVGAIAEASGFLSLSYFTRIFSEKEGASPAKWKRSKIW